MRRWLVAALWAGIAHGAQAADLPDVFDAPALRGGFSDGLSSTSVNWQGAYVGGQVGYSSSNMDFSHASSSLVGFALQNLIYKDFVAGFTLLDTASPASIGFGGFAGWNSQWDDVVLGIEANYNHLSNLAGTSANANSAEINVPTGCLVPGPGQVDVCGVKLIGDAFTKITDVVTLRGRAGWAIDNFLPYMFGGLALGRAEISRNVAIFQSDNFFLANPPNSKVGGTVTQVFTRSDSNSAFAYGYTAGLGLEAMLWHNLFARAEYEYIKFIAVKNIDVQMSTVRAGLGYKF